MKKNYCAYIEKGLRLTFREINRKIYFSRKPCCEMHSQLIPYNVSQFVPLNNIDDLIKHPSMEYFRQWTDNNDNLHPSCRSCANNEKNLNQSKRTFINQVDSADYDILRLDIVIGNLCNLACPFCDSNASSLIDKLSKSYKLDELPENWKPKLHTHANPQQISAFVSEFLKKYKVKNLKIIGGEPLLKENWQDIEKVIEDQSCNDLTLEITSNGTVVNQKLINNLQKTKSAILRISVDSIGNNYNFIRWPHTWKKMEKNLEFLANNIPKNTSVILTNLVSIFNFELLPEIDNYFSTLPFAYSFNLDLKPTSSLMHYENLPAELIKTVKDKIKNESLKLSISDFSRNTDASLLKKEIEFFLNQRKMEANCVLGKQTNKFLGLL